MVSPGTGGQEEELRMNVHFGLVVALTFPETEHTQGREGLGAVAGGRQTSSFWTREFVALQWPERQAPRIS